MDKKSVKRRGKPNRGGGRFNRGRGRGRGRGGGPPGPAPKQPAAHHGHGGRKFDDDYMWDADDGCDEDYDQDPFENPRPQTASVGAPSRGAPSRGNVAAGGSARSTQGRSGAGRSAARPGSAPVRYSSSSDRGRGGIFNRGAFNPRKVAMQHLQMSEENQSMVKDMLKDLHGNKIDVTRDENEYDELDHRSANQYWMTNSQLALEEVMVNAAAEKQPQSEKHLDITVSNLAINKLARYGFHKSRCVEVLQLCDSDVGLALEYLLAECFNYPRPDTDTDTPPDIGPDTEDEAILEQRQDEMMALEAIYEDRFSERIKNKVWVLKFDLPRLDELIKPSNASVRKPVVKDKREICPFYLRGKCKFGRRCKLKHEVPVPETASDEGKTGEGKTGYEYEVEVRFPVGNRYPEEAPFLAFSSTSLLLDKHVCLNFTKHLVREAKRMAEGLEPSVFAVASMLDDEKLIEDVYREPPHEFSTAANNRAWIRPRQQQDDKRHLYTEEYLDYEDDERGMGESDERLAEAVDVMIRMTEEAASRVKIDDRPDRPDKRDKVNKMDKVEKVEVKRVTSKEEVRRQNPGEVLRNNRRLIDDFNRKKNSARYKSMQVTRRKLPAWDKRDEILQVIEAHQVVVISGMTGCGKTTQVPQFILDLYLESSNLNLCNMLCTQPRRISAIAVAERVAEERADNLGKIVGYQIRLEKMQSSMTRLLFCTTGIVLRRLEGDTTLDGVTHIIIDEVHERSEESDFLLMYLRDMLPNRPDLKIILMSATLNAQLFAEYFGGCAVIDIPGRTFPVEQYFLEDIVDFTGFVMDQGSPYARPEKYMRGVIRGLEGEEYEEEEEEPGGGGGIKLASNRVQDQNLSVKQMFLRYPDYRKTTVKSMAMMDHTKINFDLIVDLMEWLVAENHDDLQFPATGAILVFMPGFAEIQTLFDMLRGSRVFGSRNSRRFKIIPLHSTLSSEDQHAVFAKAPEEVTKIVIATNIAETSITIDDVAFVIDAGKMKEKRYDPEKGMESLETVWVSRANALQRRGRAGRVQAGVAFHLFTSHRFDHHLLQQPIPEIQRAPLEQIVLRIRMLDIFRQVPVKDVLHKLPEPPDTEAITSAVKRLETLGALDEHGELTPLGYHLGTLPVDVRIGKLMLFGAIFRCLDPALTIAACLSFKSPFVTPFGKKEESNQKKLEFAAGNSDHITMLNAYNAWIEVKKASGQAAFRFCQDNFLSSKSLQMLCSMKQQFVELLSDIGFVREGISTRDVERADRDGGDGVLTVTGSEANLNSGNKRLVAAILVGALYPNIVQVLTPEQQFAQMGGGAVPMAPKAEDIRFKTKPDGYIKIHPSSVNFQVNYYESPYLVYHEKVKTTRIYIRDCTMVSVYPLLLFGGGQIGIDLSRGNFVLSVDDGWIRFMAQSHQIAELVRELRLELDQLLSDKIENPHMDLCTCPRGSKIITTIVKLITTQ